MLTDVSKALILSVGLVVSFHANAQTYDNNPPRPVTTRAPRVTVPPPNLYKPLFEQFNTVSRSSTMNNPVRGDARVSDNTKKSQELIRVPSSEPGRPPARCSPAWAPKQCDYIYDPGKWTR